MLVGFGISNPKNILEISPYCDGIIVGSAVIKKIMENNSPSYNNTLKFINELKTACINI